MAEDKNVTIIQRDGESFRVAHQGAAALYGDAKQDPMRHQVAGQVVHTGVAGQPLVHMVCWCEERPCEISGRVTLVGDEKQPIAVQMNHRFDNVHVQQHKVEPVEHRLTTALSDPVHHALQMRTPLQLRFCNPWHFASDYAVEIRVGDSQLISVRLTGATIATPQPCEDEKCPEIITQPVHP
jgi:hypothetical protein